MNNQLQIITLYNRQYNNILLTIFLLIIAVPSTAPGAGFQIPNQSVAAVGIAGAHVAYTPGPDSAYYNPANMSYLSDSSQVETSLTTLALPTIEYEDNRIPLLDGSSDSELFFLPQIHFVSKDIHNFRYGFSLTYPFGLAKEWDEPFQAALAQRFSLVVAEASPSFSYSHNEKYSIGGGLRLIYSDGEVMNNVTNSDLTPLGPLTSLTREMEGDDIQVGYNLAATLRPIESWSLAATYRSESDLELNGAATLQALTGEIPLSTYQGSGKLELTLPAVFSLATSFTVLGDLTLELVWNRTFWSSFDELDFEYDQSFTGTPFDSFDRPDETAWKDSDAFRVGATYLIHDNLQTTLGFAIDETPVPESTLGFELPDSDAYMYSAGIQYKQTEALTLAASYMYHHTTSRTVSNQNAAAVPGIDGTFKKGGAHAATFGLIYTF